MAHATNDMFMDDLLKALTEPTDNVLRRWMKLATTHERKQLARYAGTTLGHLEQASRAYRTEGALRLSPELAGALAEASKRVKLEILNRKPLELRREDMAPACAICPYAIRCRSEDQAKAAK